MTIHRTHGRFRQNRICSNHALQCTIPLPPTNHRTPCKTTTYKPQSHPAPACIARANASQETHFHPISTHSKPISHAPRSPHTPRNAITRRGGWHAQAIGAGMFAKPAASMAALGCGTQRENRHRFGDAPLKRPSRLLCDAIDKGDG